jgi:YD repeat-containing protein
MDKLLIIFLILFPNQIFGQSFLDHDLNIQGDMKIIYQIEFEAIEKDGLIKKGDTIECTEIRYEFDDKNRLYKEEYCLMDIMTLNEYQYDKSGKLIERMNFNQLDRQYKYDLAGNQVKELMFDSNGQMGSWEYKYDKNGNRTERIGYLGESFVERWILIYDQNDRKVKEYMTGEEPDTIATYSIITYEYDSKDRLVKTLTTNPETRVQAVYSFMYDDKDNLIQHYSKNDFQSGIVEIKTFKYESDMNGNWIRRIEFIDSKLTTITDRKIEYR